MPQSEKSLSRYRDPTQPKINKQNFLNKKSKGNLKKRKKKSKTTNQKEKKNAFQGVPSQSSHQDFHCPGQRTKMPQASWGGKKKKKRKKAFQRAIYLKLSADHKSDYVGLFCRKQDAVRKSQKSEE